ncbi:glycoside hydrolase family 28 protein [Paenibacillus sp. HB172176]|uniref:glycoside hydrolase family 28 protein n=1 Tax=Paenibacillus sp. HB172176 TaxID=2493690 RepID=UPI001F1138FE|nr:glycoside hydrolase family 28 protein [Paenibacillus sp. HB172176]
MIQDNDKNVVQINQDHAPAFVMPETELPSIPDLAVSIRDFGAIGDGIHDNTKAIHDAIEHITALGGGKVLIPAGVWLTGPIQFQNRLELSAEQGALVLFSKSFDDYPLIKSYYEGSRAVRCKSPLDAEGLEHIAITGGGIFDGGGDAWRPVKKMKMTERHWEELIRSGGVLDESGTCWWPSEAASRGEGIISKLQEQGAIEPNDFAPARDYLRPCLLSFRHCKHILIDGPTFQNSPAWCLHPWASEHITIRNAKVRNPWYAQNGDGLDVDSCRYVLVENCTFDVGDDAICVKSGKDQAGRDFGKPSEYISVRNCVVYHGHGGIVVGSEMSGGVRHVLVSDCIFLGTDIGIRFKSCRGRGGVVEKIHMKGIRMNEIAGDAISFNLYYEGRAGSGEFGGDLRAPVSVETPIFRDIHLEDISCRGARKALVINGLPEMPISNLTISKASILSEEGMVCRHAEDLRLTDIQVACRRGAGAVFHQCRTTQLLQATLASEQSEECFVEVSGELTARFEYSGLPQDVKLAVKDDVASDAIHAR